MHALCIRIVLFKFHRPIIKNMADCTQINKSSVVFQFLIWVYLKQKMKKVRNKIQKSVPKKFPHCLDIKHFENVLNR